MSDDSQLTIKVKKKKKVDLVTTSGRIDSSNAAEFDEVLKELMHGGQHHIVINMADINYMSSAGLRTLVSALRECKKKKGDVRLSSPSERVKEVLDLSGLYSMFTTYPTDVEAIDSFN